MSLRLLQKQTGRGAWGSGQRRSTNSWLGNKPQTQSGGGFYAGKGRGRGGSSFFEGGIAEEIGLQPNQEAADGVVQDWEAPPGSSVASSGALDDRNATAAAAAGGLADLEAALGAARLDVHTEAAQAWCHQQGATSVEEVLDFYDDFASALNLKKLEKTRLLRQLQASSSSASSELPSNVARPGHAATAGAVEAVQVSLRQAIALRDLVMVQEALAKSARLRDCEPMASLANEAEALLQQLQQEAQLQNELEQASLMRDVRRLRSAMEQAQLLLGEEKTARPASVLAELEAEEALQEAVAMRDVLSLQNAIGSAQHVLNTSNKSLVSATAVLTELEGESKQTLSVPGLFELLEKAQVHRFSSQVGVWCRDAGVESLAQVASRAEALVTMLPLKPLERKRLIRLLEQVPVETLDADDQQAQPEQHLQQEQSQISSQLHIAGLLDACLEARLDADCVAKIEVWAAETQCATVTDVIRSLDAMASQVLLKPLEVKRLKKSLESRANASMASKQTASTASSESPPISSSTAVPDALVTWSALAEAAHSRDATSFCKALAAAVTMGLLPEDLDRPQLDRARDSQHTREDPQNSSKRVSSLQHEVEQLQTSGREEDVCSETRLRNSQQEVAELTNETDKLREAYAQELKRAEMSEETCKQRNAEIKKWRQSWEEEELRCGSIASDAASRTFELQGELELAHAASQEEAKQAQALMQQTARGGDAVLQHEGDRERKAEEEVSILQAKLNSLQASAQKQEETSKAVLEGLNAELAKERDRIEQAQVAAVTRDSELEDMHKASDQRSRRGEESIAVVQKETSIVRLELEGARKAANVEAESSHEALRSAHEEAAALQRAYAEQTHEAQSAFETAIDRSRELADLKTESVARFQQSGAIALVARDKIAQLAKTLNLLQASAHQERIAAAAAAAKTQQQIRDLHEKSEEEQSHALAGHAAAKASNEEVERLRTICNEESCTGEANVRIGRDELAEMTTEAVRLQTTLVQTKAELAAACTEATGLRHTHVEQEQQIEAAEVARRYRDEELDALQARSSEDARRQVQHIRDVHDQVAELNLEASHLRAELAASKAVAEDLCTVVEKTKAELTARVKEVQEFETQEEQSAIEVQSVIRQRTDELDELQTSHRVEAKQSRDEILKLESKFQALVVSSQTQEEENRAVVERFRQEHAAERQDADQAQAVITSQSTELDDLRSVIKQHEERAAVAEEETFTVGRELEATRLASRMETDRGRAALRDAHEAAAALQCAFVEQVHQADLARAVADTRSKDIVKLKTESVEGAQEAGLIVAKACSKIAQLKTSLKLLRAAAAQEEHGASAAVAKAEHQASQLASEAELLRETCAGERSCFLAAEAAVASINEEVERLQATCAEQACESVAQTRTAQGELADRDIKMASLKASLVQAQAELDAASTRTERLQCAHTEQIQRAAVAEADRNSHKEEFDELQVASAEEVRCQAEHIRDVERQLLELNVKSAQLRNELEASEQLAAEERKAVDMVSATLAAQKEEFEQLGVQELQCAAEVQEAVSNSNDEMKRLQQAHALGTQESQETILELQTALQSLQESAKKEADEGLALLVKSREESSRLGGQLEQLQKELALQKDCTKHAESLSAAQNAELHDMWRANTEHHSKHEESMAAASDTMQVLQTKMHDLQKASQNEAQQAYEALGNARESTAALHQRFLKQVHASGLAQVAAEDFSKQLLWLKAASAEKARHGKELVEGSHHKCRQLAIRVKLMRALAERERQLTAVAKASAQCEAVELQEEVVKLRDAHLQECSHAQVTRAAAQKHVEKLEKLQIALTHSASFEETLADTARSELAAMEATAARVQMQAVENAQHDRDVLAQLQAKLIAATKEMEDLQQAHTTQLLRAEAAEAEGRHEGEELTVLRRASSENEESRIEYVRTAQSQISQLTCESQRMSAALKAAADAAQEEQMEMHERRAELELHIEDLHETCMQEQSKMAMAVESERMGSEELEEMRSVNKHEICESQVEIARLCMELQSLKASGAQQSEEAVATLEASKTEASEFREQLNALKEKLTTEKLCSGQAQAAAAKWQGEFQTLLQTTMEDNEQGQASLQEKVLKLSAKADSLQQDCAHERRVLESVEDVTQRHREELSRVRKAGADDASKRQQNFMVISSHVSGMRTVVTELEQRVTKQEQTSQKALHAANREVAELSKELEQWETMYAEEVERSGANERRAKGELIRLSMQVEQLKQEYEMERRQADGATEEARQLQQLREEGGTEHKPEKECAADTQARYEQVVHHKEEDQNTACADLEDVQEPQGEADMKPALGMPSEVPDEAEQRKKRLETRKAKKSKSEESMDKPMNEERNAMTQKQAASVPSHAAAKQQSNFTFELSDEMKQVATKVLKLHLHLELGLGLDAHPSWYGMIVDEIEDAPGQSGLQVGDCITSIDGVPLGEMEDCEPLFSENLAHGVQVEVEPYCEATVEMPNCWKAVNWATLQSDIEQFSEDYQVELEVCEDSGSIKALLSGPRPAISSASEEATRLLRCYFPS